MIKKILKIISKLKKKYLINHYLSFRNFNYLHSQNHSIMHISDIPYSFYSFIFNIIDLIKPEYIIHTGDIIDNLKLEINNKLRKEYRIKIINLINQFKHFKETTFILLEGNHDDFSGYENNFYENVIILKTKFCKIENIINYKNNYIKKITKKMGNMLQIIPELSFIYDSIMYYPEDKNIDNKNEVIRLNKLDKITKKYNFDQDKLFINKKLEESNLNKIIYNNLCYRIKIRDIKILISHIFNKNYFYNPFFAKEEIDYYLYGHDLIEYGNCNSAGVYTNKNCKVLNGLNYINLIRENRDIIRIKYPSTINECRKIRTGFIRGM